MFTGSSSSMMPMETYELALPGLTEISWKAIRSELFVFADIRYVSPVTARAR